MTQRVVAKSMGITQATVSLALRNDPRIPEARRREIKRTAERLGYQPSSAGSALAQMRHSSSSKPLHATLAWINFWKIPKDLRKHREFGSYFDGAVEAAQKFGYRVEEFFCSDKLSPQRLHNILTSRGIDALLLPPHRQNPDWTNFDWNPFSVIKFGQSLREPVCHMVSPDQLANAHLGIRAMQELGYARIGYVGYDDHYRLFDAGVLKAQSSLPDESRIPLLRLTGTQPRCQQQKLAAWLQRFRPDAILTDFKGLLDLLEQHGYRVPEDIGLASTTVLDGDVTAGIDQYPKEIGRVGVLSLLSLIQDHERGLPELSREILIQGSWRNGPSLPKRP